MRILTKLILLSIGGFIVCVLIFAFLIRPNLNQVGNLYNSGTTQQTELDNLSQQIVAYKNSESDLNAVQNTDQILNSILPRDSLQVGIEEVESAATLSTVSEGMTIQETTVVPGEPPAAPVIAGNPNIEEVPYTISVSGSFASLVTFLQYIEHLPHFTEVTNISLSSSTSSVDTNGVAVHSGNLTVAINGVFFVQKPSP